jgi:hypothetical protein
VGLEYLRLGSALQFLIEFQRLDQLVEHGPPEIQILQPFLQKLTVLGGRC